MAGWHDGYAERDQQIDTIGVFGKIDGLCVTSISNLTGVISVTGGLT